MRARRGPFAPFPSDRAAPSREEEVLRFWKRARVFEKSLAIRKGAPRFVFYEGPPTANGRPHPGHVLTRVVKDVFPRYKTMRGFLVPRKAGWDTHGLPVEIEVEKQIGISGKPDIERFGVGPFVKRCRASVWKYKADWERLTERIGFWLDMADPYVTYERDYIESVWWALHEIRGKGLLYRGKKSVPWCPRCGTGLSSHEVGQGYRDIEEESVYVGFRLKSDPKTLVLAWTTTPWTLPSNAALAVRPEVDYARVRVGEETLLVAAPLAAAALGKIPHEVAGTVRGADLVGQEYEPLYAHARFSERAHYVIGADFVTLDAGTGVVHIAPGYGEDDYRAGEKHGLPVIQLVGADGKFAEGTPWAGRSFKETDAEIVRDLKARALLLRTERVKHSYPHCWRCDTPLIYFARPCWFIRTTARKADLLRLNDGIRWLPEHIRAGRFGNFLETNVDWALSRERYWGTPLPMWVCEKCGAEESFPSLAALRKRNPRIPASLDLHKPAVDRATIRCRCGGTSRRVPEVVDCWFDSGAMPFAQWGYPHRGKAEFEAAFPADFISEAIDQTRGWFYSLLAISTLLFDRSPYKNCLVMGHVQDEKGQKMSKHLGNTLDPWKVIGSQGADALRWYFLSANQPWVSTRFSERAVSEAAGEFLVRIVNALHFFTSYAALDGFDPTRGVKSLARGDHRDLARATGWVPVAKRPLLDRWILSALQGTVAEVRRGLDAYDSYGAARALAAFVDGLSNWYIRRSRPRFWGSEDTADKRAAHFTLYECLSVLARLAAPLTPFLAEEMHEALARGPFGRRAAASVHLEGFPEPDPAVRDPALESRMDAAREAVSLGHAARREAQLRVRQPLSEAIVVADRARAGNVRDLADIVRDELNVKAVTIAEEVSAYATVSVKPNFRALGPKLGARVGECAKALAALPALEACRAAAGEALAVSVGGESLTLAPEELDVRLSAKPDFAAKAGHGMVVVLRTEVTPDLKAEGTARELISRIQGMRKELGLPYEARIGTTIEASGEIAAAAERHRDLLRGETLSETLLLAKAAGELVKEEELDGGVVRIGISQVAEGKPRARRAKRKSR
ncbi:MAG: isoleucine--tRNA ligase [Planctomycetales bacterium]|nr:isoleucine--tRNA ligase [Planctomycetales bacterium]